MMKNVLSFIFVAGLALFVSQPARAQTVITVIAPGSAHAALEKLIPAFESKTGYKIESTGGNGLETKKRVVQGEAFDVPIVQSPLEDVIASGNVVVGTQTLLATMPVFVAVRKGSAKPDISTPVAAKRMFLAAKSVSYPGAALGAGVGVSIDETLQKLGIFDQVQAKSKLTRTGGAAMALVAKGEVEIGLTFLNEISDPGVDVVGPLPLWWDSSPLTRKTQSRPRRCSNSFPRPMPRRSTKSRDISRATDLTGGCGGVGLSLLAFHTLNSCIFRRYHHIIERLILPGAADVFPKFFLRRAVIKFLESRPGLVAPRFGIGERHFDHQIVLVQ
jgi:molybdate transport system substrate-binding protein